MHFTNSVYFREEKVLSNLFGQFPSLSFINDELNEIAGFLRFDRRFDDLTGIPVINTLRSKECSGLGTFALPAVFLSPQRRSDSFLIEREFQINDNDFPERELRRFRYRKLPRLGDYDYEKNLITLYVPNIEKEVSSVDELKSYLSMVVAHELFHAYQYYVSPEKSKQYGKLVHRDGTVDKIVQVMEATADFFAFLWLTERMTYHMNGYDEEVRNKRFWAWQKNDIDLWPYAGAKYCVRDYRDSMITDTRDLIGLDSKARRFREVLIGFIDNNVSIDQLVDMLTA